MPESVLLSHEALLQLCAATAPRPWYPREYAKSSGVPRDDLDSPLNDLRVAGLIKLTDWTRELGQGYVLTDLGDQVLKNPVHLAQLRAGLQAPSIKPRIEAEETPEAAPLTPYERGEEARTALYEPQAPRVMPILLLINLMAFAFSFYFAIRANVPVGDFLMAGGQTADVLHELGALRPVDLIHGEWWRLLSCAFLHFGILHLIVNMVSLWMLGQYESLWTPPRFLVIYLMSALGGSMAAMIWNPVEATLAGASGAIWGLMTSLAVWIFINRSHVQSEQLASRIPNFAVLFVMNVGISFMPGISASAHFGGGIVGAIFGALLQWHRYAMPPRKTIAAVAMCLLPVIGFGALNKVIENDPRWQRIRVLDTERASQLAAQQFKKEVVPAVDKVAATWTNVESHALIVSDNPPDKRLPEVVQKVRNDLKNVIDATREALDKVGSKKAENERHEQARQAAIELLTRIKSSAEHIDGLLDKKLAWTNDERISFVNNLRAAAKSWNKANEALP